MKTSVILIFALLTVLKVTAQNPEPVNKNAIS